jgi:hypothetical protein
MSDPDAQLAKKLSANLAKGTVAVLLQLVTTLSADWCATHLRQLIGALHISDS